MKEGDDSSDEDSEEGGSGREDEDVQVGIVK